MASKFVFFWTILLPSVYKSPEWSRLQIQKTLGRRHHCDKANANGVYGKTCGSGSKATRTLNPLPRGFGSTLQIPQTNCAAKKRKSTASSGNRRGPGRHATTTKSQTHIRARLLKRVFNIDITICQKCQGEIRIIAAIEDPKVIKKILEHMGLPSNAPKLAYARGPLTSDQSDFCV